MRLEWRRVLHTTGTIEGQLPTHRRKTQPVQSVVVVIAAPSYLAADSRIQIQPRLGYQGYRW